MKLTEAQNKTLDNSEKEKQKLENKTIALWIAALRFTDNTTMHGLRYVFRSDSNIMRRLIWFCFILGGMSYCIYIMCRSVNDYFEYPTVMRSKTKYEPSSVFPAVIICSYNIYQKSSLTPKEERLLESMFNNYGSKTFDKEINVTDYEYLDGMEFMKRTSFKTVPDWCLFHSRECRSEIMGTAVTDMGICIRIGANASSTLEQTAIGLGEGLDVGLEQNESEWTVGPYMYYSGFRVSIDPADSHITTLRHRGFSLLPGDITDAVLSRKETTLLPPPYGQCGEVKLANYDRYTRRGCLNECEANYTIKQCGCRYYYHPGNEKTCNYAQVFVCLQEIMKLYENQSKDIFSFSECNCPQECFYIEYKVSVTNTKRSPQYTSRFKFVGGLDLSKGTALRLYYPNLEYTVVTEEAVYSFEKLMCDIGGAGGLFLGCSFATLFEFCDFSFDIFWIWLFRKMQQRQRKNSISVNS